MSDQTPTRRPSAIRRTFDSDERDLTMAPLPQRGRDRPGLQSGSMSQSLQSSPQQYGTPPHSLGTQIGLSGSPGSSQRYTPPPPPPTSRRPPPRRNLFGAGPSGSPGQAKPLSSLATSSTPPTSSRSLFAEQPSRSPVAPPPPGQASTSRSYLSMARNLFNLGGSTSSQQSRSPIQEQSLQQVEPSVRPKIRGHPTGMSSSPSPEIVKQFRRPDTGSPDFDRMRQMSRPTSELPRMAGYDLASRSQMEMGRIYGRYGRPDRKEKVLRDREWIHDHLGDRWIRRGDWRGPSETGVERRALRPRSRSERDLYDDRFQQSISTMGERPISQIMPTGRLGYGPISQRNRSYSMSDLQSLRVPGIKEDPSMWSNRQREFAQRLKGLSKEDVKRYRTYRWYADADRYPGVAKRMLPPPTGTNLMDENKKRVTEYIRRSASAPGRMERRSRVRQHSVLPSTIYPDNTDPYPTIRERNETRRLPTDLPSGQEGPLQRRSRSSRPPPQARPEPLPILQPLRDSGAPSPIQERRQRRWSFDSGQLQSAGRSPVRPTRPEPSQSRPSPSKKKDDDQGSCQIM